MRLSILLAVALLAGGGDPAARGQATAFVSATGEIPRDSYKTWTLFLICNPDWVSPERSADLTNLFHRFQSFGDAIGRENLAVWFWKKDTSLNDPQLAGNVDVARSAEFCRVLKRPPSQGPYIVVTTEYPDLQAFPTDRAVFELGGVPAAEVARLLTVMTDQLLLQGKVDAALAAARVGTDPAEPTAAATEPPTSGLWMRLLEGTRRSLVGFGCMVKLQIATSLFSAELRACSDR